MSINITLTEEQITDVLDKDIDLKYQLFRDATGPGSISENSTFPERLKFYMDKKGVNSSDVVTFFKSNYPFLAKSTSTIQHYLNGVRTPGLSTVFALADFLDIAPALLLPAKPGKYIAYKGDHVEMIEPEIVEEDNNVVIETTIEDVSTAQDTDATTQEDTTPLENNNVVIQDSVEIPSEAIEDYNSSQDENDSQLEDEIDPVEAIEVDADNPISDDNNVVIEEEDYMEGDPVDAPTPTEEPEATSTDTSDDFELDDVSDSSEADNFLKDLFGDSTSTPFEDYNKGSK